MNGGPVLPEEAAAMLDAFAAEHGVSPRVWMQGGSGWTVVHPPDGNTHGVPPDGALEVTPGDAGTGAVRLEIVGEGPAAANGSAGFLATTLAAFLQLKSELDNSTNALSDAYEEIDLLYTISEISGANIDLNKATADILFQVVDNLQAQRAALWIHEPESSHLRLAAMVGGSGVAPPVPVHDACSITAHVFRDQVAVLLAPGEEFPRPGCQPHEKQPGAVLSVPVSFTPPNGDARAIGVINLIGRAGEGPFSAGDRKLLSAIASQVGAAVENNRLIAASLRQERFMREVELAHDLQLKLLPPVEPFAGHADVAVRCVPANSVGGDFYHLFRLGPGRIGVMIGDVSGHGFGAALIMALTMSAVAIHASEGDPPAEVMRRVHRALIDELESTGMYLTLFYGVIDARQGRIVYANAGHAHAFRVPGAGEPERLGATDPPLGVSDNDEYSETEAAWVGGEDLLFLFTDGLSDAVGAGEIEGSRVLVDGVSRERNRPLDRVIEHLFRISDHDVDTPPDDRTAVLVRI